MGCLFSIDGKKVQTPSKANYNLVPIVADENRLEDATLTLRPVTHKYKSMWAYDEYIIGSSLMEILGESWEKYVSNKKYKFRVAMPGFNGGQLEFDAYFAEVKFDLVIMNDDPKLRVYNGFSITWIEY